MKSEMNPLIAGVVIVILLGIVGFFLWRGTSGGGGKRPGDVGNPGPFSPGGNMAGKGGGKPAAANGMSGGPPGR